MNLSLRTYNGSTINPTGQSAVIPKPDVVLDATPISTPRADAPALYGGKNFKPDEFDVLIAWDKATTDGTALAAAVERVGQIFNTRDPDLHQLVAADTNDSSTLYYVDCTPVGAVKQDAYTAKIKMWSPDPVWRRVAASLGTIVVPLGGTASGTITNNGNVDTYPTLTLTPSADGGLYLYRWHVIVYNPTVRALTNYPLNIAGTAWNSGAEISAGRLQSDGDDIRVTDKGVIIPCWGGTLNSAAGKVWVKLNFQPGISLTLKTAVGDSGATQLVFNNTPTNVANMKRLPASGLLYAGTECIAYTAKNVTKLSVTIDDDGRGVKDTTAASHTANTTFYWIEHDLVILTGNSGATAPSQDDRRKPVFSLDNSSNTEWRWDSADSYLGDSTGLRMGGWKPSRVAGRYSSFYTSPQGTANADPYEAIGSQIESYASGAIFKSEIGTMDWTLQNNVGFTSVSLAGQKYRNPASCPWPGARLQSSKDGVTWVNEWTDPTPGTADTWTAWAHADEALPTGTRFLRMRFHGAVNAVDGAQASFEIDPGSAGSVGVDLASANVPVIVLGARASNAEINATITNVTTGDAISYSYPAKNGRALIINTENRTVAYNGKRLAPPELNGVRREWLRLVPGANVLQYSDDNCAGLNLVVSYRERKNI